MTPEQGLERDIAEWTQLKDWLAIAKEREMFLRKEIADRIFSDIKPQPGVFPEGTSHGVGIGAVANWKADLVSKWQRDLLVEMITPTWAEAALTPAEADGLIKYTPELGIRAYKKLPPAKRLIVDKMIVTKQANITLEVTQLPK